VTDYKGCKKVFQHFCGVNDDYITSSTMRMASSDTPYNYAQIDSAPHLKKRILSAMDRSKKELGFKGPLPDYFDEQRWANLLTNQIYQINRVNDTDPFAHVLIREAENMIKDYYGIIKS